MSSTPAPRQAWRIGYTLLLINPFIGLAIVFLDVPRWLEFVGVAFILVSVGVGVALMRQPTGGWRPSDTLADPDDR